MPQTLTDYWELADKLVSLCEVLVEKLNLMPPNREDGFYKLRDFLKFFKKTISQLETLSFNDSLEAKNLRAKSHAFQDLGFAARTINTQNKPEIEPQITSSALLLALSFHQLAVSLLVRENYTYQPQAQNNFLGRDTLIALIKKESDEIYDDMKKTVEKIGSILYKAAVSCYFKNEMLPTLSLINAIARLDPNKFTILKEILAEDFYSEEDKYSYLIKKFKENTRSNCNKQYTFFYSQYFENMEKFRNVLITSLKKEINYSPFLIEFIELLDDFCLKKLHEILDADFSKANPFDRCTVKNNLVILVVLSRYDSETKSQKRDETLLRFAVEQLSNSERHEIFLSATHVLSKSDEEKKTLIKELYSNNCFLIENKITHLVQGHHKIFPKQGITDLQMLNALMRQAHLSLGEEHPLTNLLREKKELHQTELSSLFRQLLMQENCTIELIESEIEKKLLTVPDSYRPKESIIGALYKEFLKGKKYEERWPKDDWILDLYELLDRHIQAVLGNSKGNLLDDIKDLYSKNNALLLRYRFEFFFEDILAKYPNFTKEESRSKEKMVVKFQQISLSSRKGSSEKKESELNLKAIKIAYEFYLEIRILSVYEKMLRKPLREDDKKRVCSECFNKIDYLLELTESLDIAQEDRNTLLVTLSKKKQVFDQKIREDALDSMVEINIDYCDPDKSYQALFKLFQDLIASIFFGSSKIFNLQDERIYAVYTSIIKERVSSFIQLEQFFCKIKSQAVENLAKNNEAKEMIAGITFFYHFLYSLRGIYKSFPGENEPHFLYEDYVFFAKKANETLNSFKDSWSNDTDHFNEKKNLIRQFMVSHIRTVNKELEQVDNLDKEYDKISMPSIESFEFWKGNDVSETSSLHEEQSNLPTEENRPKRLFH